MTAFGKGLLTGALAVAIVLAAVVALGSASRRAAGLPALAPEASVAVDQAAIAADDTILLSRRVSGGNVAAERAKMLEDSRTLTAHLTLAGVSNRVIRSEVELALSRVDGDCGACSSWLRADLP